VGSNLEDVTDIDIVVLEAGKRIYYQFKSSRRAFISYAETTGWVAKAMKDLGPSASYSQIRYVVPDLSMVPPKKIKPWLENQVPPIQVFDDIPLTP
jgi:hypothetical protein